jgi:dTDP-4-dehydrorhamnose reductase
VETIKELMWLITGSNGQLAKALITELTLNNYRFVALNHQEFDITDPTEVEYRISKILPDVVVNTAAFTNVEQAEDFPDIAYNVNALGPRFLADACHRYAAVLVHLSTDYVFSGEKKSPYLVTDSPAPISVYGNSKAKGEEEILRSSLRSSYILRTAWLFGVAKQSFAKKILISAISGKNEIRVVDDQIGQPTSARDLARRIIEVIAKEPPFGIWHATNAGSASWYEFAQEIFRLSGEDVSRVVPIKSGELNMKARRPRYSVLNHDQWETANIEKMKHWRISLTEEFPKLLESLNEWDLP